MDPAPFGAVRSFSCYRADGRATKIWQRGCREGAESSAGAGLGHDVLVDRIGVFCSGLQVCAMLLVFASRETDRCTKLYYV